MKNFLFALCTVSLLANGVAAAKNGVARSAVTKVKQAAVTIVAAAAFSCGLMGCDLADNVVHDAMSTQASYQGEPVKVGVIYEHEFPQSLKGAELAALQINGAGGINGRYLELITHKIYIRSKADAVRAAENLIIHDEVLAIVGANYSTISELIDEVVAVYDVPMVTMGSTSATLTRASESIFLAAFPDTFQGYVMAKLATDDLKADTAAVVFWGADAYSSGLAGSFRDSFRELGGTVVSYRAYSYETTNMNEDFAAELNASGIVGDVVAAQPDVVFIPGFSESGIVAVELRKAGEDATLLGADGWGAGDLVTFGGDAVDGAYFSDHFTPDAAPEFTNLYTKAYGNTPDGLSALGYDAMRIVAEAAQRTGDDLTRPTLRDEIAATENYTGATSIARYDEERHPIKSAVIFTLKDGTKVYYKTVDP